MNDLTITVLGSVSPYCYQNKNNPGFLVTYKDYNFLLDSGSGITRLLKFPDVLNNLHVFLTHYHWDHLGDLGSLLYASYVYHNLGLLSTKIKIYLPPFNETNRYLYSQIITNQESYASYIKNTGNYFINNLKVTCQDNHSHSVPSLMIKLETADFKIVYTGDIGSTNLNGVIDFCQDCDIIICESTFLHNEKKANKTHLSAYEAGIIAKEAQAKMLLLTHFWPEQDKNMYLLEAKTNFLNTTVAIEGEKLILRKEKNNERTR